MDPVPETETITPVSQRSLQVPVLNLDPRLFRKQRPRPPTRHDGVLTLTTNLGEGQPSLVRLRERRGGVPTTLTLGIFHAENASALSPLFVTWLQDPPGFSNALLFFRYLVFRG